MIFIDTNYFLRFLIKEDDKLHQEALRVITDAAEGRAKTGTSVVVIFEIYWVLSSFYQMDKAHVAGLLIKLLQMEFVNIENRNILAQAIDLYQKTPLDLEDSYNLFYAKQNGYEKFMTFDKILKKTADKYF